MNLPIGTSFDIAESGTSASETPHPQIIWPTMVLGKHGYEEGDVKCFPEGHEYRARYVLGIGGAMSSVFFRAARQARERIWLVDDYLLASAESVNRLGMMLFETGATDIRIAAAEKNLAKEGAEFLRGLAPDLQKHNSSGIPIRIHILLNLRGAQTRDVPDVHDRYAIIDDVLWHCGATIGGLHNAVNAMTFGWSARDTRAIEFFEHLWKLLKDDDDRYR